MANTSKRHMYPYQHVHMVKRVDGGREMSLRIVQSLDIPSYLLHLHERREEAGSNAGDRKASRIDARTIFSETSAFERIS